MTIESAVLKAKGAKWWHSSEHEGALNLSKAALGEFFAVVLSSGAQIGQVWPFSAEPRSWVGVTVFMTDDQKAKIEGATRFRFQRPPQVSLNSADGA